MGSSTWGHRHVVFQELVRQMRKEAGLTQSDLAGLLGKPQSYVSKYESGERRLDIIEVEIVCRTCGLSLQEFAGKLDAALSNRGLE